MEVLLEEEVHKTVISKWVYGMHAMNTVCEGLEDLANIKMDTTDQHICASLFTCKQR